MNGKCLGIMQPYLFPYIGYFQLINAVDKFILYDDVNFITRGWINRNKILIDGKAYLFTIPLSGASQNKLINEINLVEDGKWKLKFFKTIEINYKKAPFFETVSPLIHEIIESPFQKIAELIVYSLKLINEYLGIKTLIVSSSVYKNIQLKGQTRILDICRRENADKYINLIGGMELYSQEAFKENNIELSFIKPLSFQYNQFNMEFVPWLSIIDILMFNSVVTIIDILNSKCELI
jgi:hypothetical protein